MSRVRLREYGIAHKWAAGEARSSARCGSSENGRARRRRQGHQANATTQRLQGRAQRPPACSQRASGSTRAARRAPPYPPPPPGEARTPLSHAAERGGDPASKQPASKERAAPAPGVQAKPARRGQGGQRGRRRRRWRGGVGARAARRKKGGNQRPQRRGIGQSHGEQAQKKGISRQRSPQTITTTVQETGERQQSSPEEMINCRTHIPEDQRQLPGRHH